MVLIVGLWFATIKMRGVINNFNASTILHFIFWAILVMLTIWWKDSKLSLKLTRLEDSFWSVMRNTCDTRMVTRAKGQTSARGSELLTAAIGSCWVVYICTMFLAIPGFLASSILCSFLLVRCVTKYIHNNNPHWDWRLGIIDNMSSWTVVTLTILATALVLLAIELFLPLEMYKPNNLRPIIQAIKKGQFRTISPSKSELLEEDCQKYFYKLAEDDFLKTKKTTAIDKKTFQERWIKKSMRYYSLHYFAITAIAIYLFSIMPLCSILRAQKTWIHEIGKELNKGPFMPYIPQAWKWTTPCSMRVLILFHWVIGGIINILAIAFCIDSLSYLLKGQSFLFEKTANLWSWVFAACKILFGITAGQKMGAIFIILVSMPALILFATFIRRGIFNVILTIKVSLNRFFSLNHQNPKILSMTEFVKQICSESNLLTPTIILVNSNDIIIYLRSLPLGGKSIIELSNGTIELLTQQELKAVIAHELGHVRQGLWKVSVLKSLSSLAMFPNYYLTLCLDWAKKEMDADQFALAVTKDPQSLKQALIKISTAQIPYSILATDSNLGFFNKSLKAKLEIFSKRLHSIVISVKFFFGDGLFGYVHPYLSERLKAIETNGL